MRVETGAGAVAGEPQATGMGGDLVGLTTGGAGVAQTWAVMGGTGLDMIGRVAWRGSAGKSVALGLQRTQSSSRCAHWLGMPHCVVASAHCGAHCALLAQ
jgi:hypothetical protein